MKVEKLMFIRRSQLDDSQTLILDALLEALDGEIMYNGDETYLLYLDVVRPTLVEHKRLHPSRFAFTTVRGGLENVSFEPIPSYVEAILI